MSESQPQEKVTVTIASKALNVDRRTIYRWMDKGLISKVKEGNNTYVLMDDVRALRDKTMSHDKKADVTKNRGKGEAISDTVTVERTHYEGLLTRLGQLEAKQELLLEYKAGIEAKDRAIVEAEQLLKEKNKVMERAGRRIQELQAEVERLRLPWYRRIFRTFRV